jgi:hypothetical protein
VTVVLVVEERRFGMGLNWTLIIHFRKRGKFFIFFPFGYKQLILGNRFGAVIKYSTQFSLLTIGLV